MSPGSAELEELLGAWFSGWAALRSYRTLTGAGYHAALRLDRGGEWEYFTSDPEPARFAVLAAEVARAEDAAMSVLGPDIHRYVHQGHAAGLGMLSASEQMMVAGMETQDNQDPFLGDPELVLDVRRMGGRRAASRCQARLSGAIVRGGTVLASGNVAVTGDYAVFDQIETHAAYRHRGYGLLLMQSLAAHAKEYSVTTGLLLASTDGQRLCYKMGWRSAGAMTVLVPRARLERDMARK